MRAQNIKLLVVGGSGFIGRHIVRHAIGRRWDVVTLGRGPASDQLPGSVSRIHADITDREGLCAALEGHSFDYVVNCGGQIDHRAFFAGGDCMLDVHFQGVLNLVAALKRDPLRMFINIGSSDEYGSAIAPQTESQRETPISPYSLGKACATHFLQMLHRTERFPAAVLRLFLTYGPGQDAARFLPQVIHGCLTDAVFPASEGHQLRDFCYIDDVVRAVFLTLDRPDLAGEVINIASGQPVSIRQIIESIREIVGRGTPLYGKVPYRSGENMALFADVSKAKQLLGWSAETPLQTGLAETIKWMASQK